jgi:hypothetical protein
LVQPSTQFRGAEYRSSFAAILLAASTVSAHAIDETGGGGAQALNASSLRRWLEDAVLVLVAAAADRGNAIAMRLLGVLYQNGLGVTKNYAKTLYLVYDGKVLSEQDPRLWERAIAEDFAEFRKAGLTHPVMADIEKELGVSP